MTTTKNNQIEAAADRPDLGLELFEIKPIILGGDPIDPANKTWLTRKQHFEAVRYWNRVVHELKHITIGDAHWRAGVK